MPGTSLMTMLTRSPVATALKSAVSAVFSIEPEARADSIDMLSVSRSH